MTNSTARSGALTPPSPLPSGGVEAWIASAHSSPEAVYQEWDGECRLALIPLGKLFDAVRIPEHLVHGVAEVSDPSTVSGWLGWIFNGRPVIHDPAGRRYYALVPPGTARLWRAPAAACLGDGTYLGVPRTDVTGLEGHAWGSYWAVPVTRPGWLCRTSDVLTFVMVAGCLTDADCEAES
ncbi:hypothetical protein BN159_0364 [Streptomyces davaonensis JCM 4913]|uniref:Uncharacterized protein n=1 Tax=Streptomyces davaonensis (strain DSM 101723 / JCM 4913 / KCC S-0913 / 768) TaxID=1214101 RepID=K4QUT1_STRDJ|nr:hypothetical protein BN159_0364 [Streptomyces davaonensis JCM 4913]